MGLTGRGRGLGWGARPDTGWGCCNGWLGWWGDNGPREVGGGWSRGGCHSQPSTEPGSNTLLCTTKFTTKPLPYNGVTYNIELVVSHTHTLLSASLQTLSIKAY